MKTVPCLLAALAIAALVTTGLASTAAQAQGLQSAYFARWRLQDKCLTDAAAQHPDRDPASLRARETAANTCLQAHGFAPRNITIAPRDVSAKPASPKDGTAH